jgi:hypothetical protein
MNCAGEGSVETGCYRRLLLVISRRITWPHIAILCASAWPARDAVAQVAMLSDRTRRKRAAHHGQR